MSYNVQLILIFSVIILSANNANKIEIKSKIDSGINDKYYRCQFPFSINGTQYFYGQSEFGNNWFIRELLADGTMGNETHKGHFNEFYAIQFPFLIDGKQYFYGQNAVGKNWFIRELEPNGKMGEETDHGRFFKFYDTQFSFSMDGRVYFYGQSKSGYNWFIQELKAGGRMSKETDHGRFGKFYGIQFPFSINGKQCFYGQSESGNNWFIQELRFDGKMGKEVDHGHFQHFYDIHVPFSYGGQLFFYGESKAGRKWFIHKLLPNGKIDSEENSGISSTFYRTQFVFSTGDQQFVYRQNSEVKYWSIVEVYLCKANTWPLSRRNFTDYRLASWNMRGTSKPELIWTNIEAEVRNADNDEDADEYNDFRLDLVALQESGAHPSFLQHVGQDHDISPSPVTFIEAKNPNEFNLTQRLLTRGTDSTTSRPDNLHFYHVGSSRTKERTSMGIISRQKADEVLMVRPIDSPIIGIRLGFDYFFNIHAGSAASDKIPEAITVIEHFMDQRLRTHPLVTWVIVGDYNTDPSDMRRYLPTPPRNIYRIFVVPSNPSYFGSETDRILDYAITGRGISNDGELVPQANDRTSTDDAILTFMSLTTQPLRNCRDG